MRTNTEKAEPLDSPETVRRRTRYRWATGIIWTNGIIFVAAGLLGQVFDWLGRDDLIDDYYIVWIVLVTVPLFLFNFYILRRFRRSLELAERRDRASELRSDTLVLKPVEPQIYSARVDDSPETARLRARHRRNVRGGWVALTVGVASWFLLMIDVAAHIVIWMMIIGFGAAIFIVIRDTWKGSLQSAVAEGVQRDIDARLAAEVETARRNTAGPVLYLRSFSDDDPAAKRHGALTEEEHLTRALAWIGPLVAVGKPGERLTQVGAQRIYLTNDAWQARVSDLMRSAAMVVLRTGSSEGFHWEVRQALATLSPEQLLLVVDNRKELRGVLDVMAGQLGRPRAKVRCRGKSIGTVKGLVMFEAGWSPRSLRLRRGTMRALGEDGPLTGRFMLSLRPLFDRRGLAPQIPPLSGMKIFWVAFPVFWAIVVAVADYLD